MKWITDSNDERLRAPPRGEPDEAIARGGWRCAGAMGFYPDLRDKRGDHLVAVPFWEGDGDPRHSCYCADCAHDLGIEGP